MEYAIEVLEADLERCKQEIGFDCNTTKWQQKIFELETAIQKLKSGHCAECKIAQENLELISENQKLRGEK